MVDSIDIKINSEETLESAIEKLTTTAGQPERQKEGKDAEKFEGTITLSHKNGNWFTSVNLKRLTDAIRRQQNDSKIQIGLLCFGLTLLLQEGAPSMTAEIYNFMECVSPRDIILVGDPRPTTIGSGSGSGGTEEDAEETTPPPMITYGVEMLTQMITWIIPSSSCQTLSIAGVKFNGTPTQMQEFANALSKLQLESLEILESDVVNNSEGKPCSLEPLLHSLAGMDSMTSLKLGSRFDLTTSDRDDNHQLQLQGVYQGLEKFSIDLERPIGNHDKTRHLQSTLCMIEALKKNESIKTVSIDTDHTVTYWDQQDKQKIVDELQSTLKTTNYDIINLDFVGDDEGREFWETNSKTIQFYVNLNNCGRKSFLTKVINEEGTNNHAAATEQLIQSLVEAQDIPSCVSEESEEISCIFYFLSFKPDLWVY